MKNAALGLDRALLTLLMVLLCSPVVAQDRDREEFEKRFKEGIDLLQRKEYAAAVKAFRECIEIDSQSAPSYYNVACAYSLWGKKHKALIWLAESVRRGFFNFEHLEGDKDLEPLRTLSGYRKIVAGLKERFENRFTFRVHAPTSYDPDRAYPLLVILHGLGVDETDMTAVFARYAASRGVILLAPRGDASRGNGFAWGELARRTVMKAVEETRAIYNVDPRRIALGGFSQGGYHAYDIGLAHPQVFTKLVPISGFYDPARIAPLAVTMKRKPDLYLIHGQRDRTIDNFRKVHAALVASRFRVAKDEHAGGHSLPEKKADLDRLMRGLFDWLVR